jgi:hypothetical protein
MKIIREICSTVCGEMTWYDFFTNLIRNWISCESTIVENDDTVIDKSQRTLQVGRTNPFRVGEFCFLGCGRGMY